MALGNFFKKKPVTADTSVAQESKAPSEEMEKGGPAELQEGNGVAHHVHIDPEIEKRVVRKMDRTVIPIVMALCMSELIIETGKNY